ncbi:hypothetical protein AYI68_g564 [Smittium mucronatum]|uniref:Uncharacterized protein n=1 Tax=Smittium mucronatum TaxID=133383 RepID=A0A1R0H836_9FUNG|nr:hypothetical protein AYI68_g564 [Smittium mucronatum]
MRVLMSDIFASGTQVQSNNLPAYGSGKFISLNSSKKPEKWIQGSQALSQAPEGWHSELYFHKFFTAQNTDT